MTNWICTQCDETVKDQDVIGNGYGHTVAVRDEKGNYIEDVCGPLRREEPPEESVVP